MGGATSKPLQILHILRTVVIQKSAEVPPIRTPISDRERITFESGPQATSNREVRLTESNQPVTSVPKPLGPTRRTEDQHRRSIKRLEPAENQRKTHSTQQKTDRSNGTLTRPMKEDEPECPQWIENFENYTKDYRSYIQNRRGPAPRLRLVEERRANARHRDSY